MAKLLGLLTVLLIVAVSFYQNKHTNLAYQNWKTTFGMEFQQKQDIYRSIIFAKNLKIIEEHNSNPSKTYKMAINQFTGYTQQQFVEVMLRDKIISAVNSNLKVDIQRKSSNVNIDWTTKGQVSPVKNQGNCGSCWAFSAVAVLQSYALSKGQSVNLSEQQLVDCSHLYGNFGCDGGQNYQALAYVRDHGLTDTQSYPYVAKNQLCKIHGGSFKITHVRSVKGCANIETEIQERPIGVAVDATNWSKYGSGIFDNCAKHLNHNVLLVGMTDSFYKIKNSWGTSWGEQGFIRLALGNTCGICQDKSPWAE